MKFIPYLYFAGDAEAAMAFYAKALGGEVVNVVRYGAEDYPAMEGKILHGEVGFAGIELYLSDQPEAVFEGNRIHLTLDLDSEAAITTTYHNLSEGAKGKGMELGETFWGAVYGSLTDRYGVTWDLNWQKSPRRV